MMVIVCETEQPEAKVAVMVTLNCPKAVMLSMPLRAPEDDNDKLAGNEPDVIANVAMPPYTEGVLLIEVPANATIEVLLYVNP